MHEIKDAELIYFNEVCGRFDIPKMVEEYYKTGAEYMSKISKLLMFVKAMG